MTQDELNTIKVQLQALYAEQLEPLVKRPKGHGNLSKLQFDALLSGFADGMHNIINHLSDHGHLDLKK